VLYACNRCKLATVLGKAPTLSTENINNYDNNSQAFQLIVLARYPLYACNRCKLAAVIGKALTLSTERNAAAVSRVFKQSEVKEAIYQRLDFAEEHAVKKRVPRRQPSLEASDLMQHYPPISLQRASTGEPEYTSPAVTHTIRKLARCIIECD